MSKKQTEAQTSIPGTEAAPAPAPASTREYVGAYIKRHLQKKYDGKPAYIIAAEAGVTLSCVNNMQAGRNNPDVNELHALAEACGLKFYAENAEGERTEICLLRPPPREKGPKSGV